MFLGQGFALDYWLIMSSLIFLLIYDIINYTKKIAERQEVFIMSFLFLLLIFAWIFPTIGKIVIYLSIILGIGCAVNALVEIDINRFFYTLIFIVGVIIVLALSY